MIMGIFGVSRMSLGLISAGVLTLCAHAAPAQEMPAAPRTPMAPGSFWFKDGKAWIGMVPHTKEGMPYMAAPTMAPPHLMAPQRRMDGPGPDLAALEANAIEMLRNKKADVVVLSKANTNLVLQLYRPDQNEWQEYNLVPLNLTPIICQPCNGTLRFAFSNGSRQAEMDVEVPSLLRVFPDASTNQWHWDYFKLVFASVPQEPSQPPQ
jgi:hypothetical protein